MQYHSAAVQSLPFERARRYGAAILSMTVALAAGNSLRRYNLPHPLISFVAIAMPFCHAMEWCTAVLCARDKETEL
jgi:hypothetical protein